MKNIWKWIKRILVIITSILSLIFIVFLIIFIKDENKKLKKLYDKNLNKLKEGLKKDEKTINNHTIDDYNNDGTIK